MNYNRTIILAIPLLLSTSILWSMQETQITNREEFQDQIDGLKEKKERIKHKEKAKLFAKIGSVLPCFCFGACYHCYKARE